MIRRDMEMNPDTNRSQTTHVNGLSESDRDRMVSDSSGAYSDEETIVPTSQSSDVSRQLVAKPEMKPLLLLEPELSQSGQFGRYLILKELGRGGMGSVFLAHDSLLDRQVALKTVLKEYSGDSGVLARFNREARIAAKMQHPNICPIFDVGIERDTFYLSMAYVKGQTLHDRMPALQSGPITGILLLLRKIAKALSYAHSHEYGFIHRDLKPANIMIDESGEPILMDFGLAIPLRNEQRLTTTGDIVGTPAYMSPEQLVTTYGPVTTTSDIYSLGVIFYELLTGDTPFTGSVTEVLMQTASETPTPSPAIRRPDIEPAIEKLCLRMLAKNPKERISSGAELIDEIDAVVAEFPDSDSETAVLPEKEKWGRPVGTESRRKSKNFSLSSPAILASMIVLIPLVVSLGIYSLNPEKQGSGTPENAMTLGNEKAEGSVQHSQPSGEGSFVSGKVDLYFWSQNGESKQAMKLGENLQFPIRPDDRIRIEVDFPENVYAYIVWIDPNGDVVPVYPWKPGSWELPKELNATSAISLPPDPSSGYPLDEITGYETMVVLAGLEPLPSSQLSSAQFKLKLPELDGQDASGRAWVNGVPLFAESGSSQERSPIFSQPQPINNPVTQSQLKFREKLKQSLQPEFIHVVTFAKNEEE